MKLVLALAAACAMVAFALHEVSEVAFAVVDALHK